MVRSPIDDDKTFLNIFLYMNLTRIFNLFHLSDISWWQNESDIRMVQLFSWNIYDNITFIYMILGISARQLFSGIHVYFSYFCL